jgi:hypothetical protein
MLALPSLQEAMFIEEKWFNSLKSSGNCMYHLL